jgi:hypothetical protein
MEPPRTGPPNPYVDYSRQLTAEGGIALTYKDIDDRLRHTLWRVAAWLVINGITFEYARHGSPIASPLLNAILVIAAAIISWLILARPIECYRHIEIRPDCMIIDHADVFWRGYMELGFPQCRPGADGHLILSGVYGTRHIEFMIIRSFDENDRAPQVFAAHLHAAMQQQWGGVGRS